MKKNILKTLLTTAVALAFGTNAFAWDWNTPGQGELHNGVWYALRELYDGSEIWFEYANPDHKKPVSYNLSAPGKKLTFDLNTNYSKAWEWLFYGGNIEVKEEDPKEIIIYKRNDVPKNTSFEPQDEYISPLNPETKKITFYTPNESQTYRRYVKNVFVTQATLLEVSTTSLDFGTITIGDKVDSQTFTFKYSNGTAGKGLSVTENLGEAFSATQANAAQLGEGWYGQQSITVTFAPKTVGVYRQTITLSGNGAPEQTVVLTGTVLPAAPDALDATNVHAKTFTANWTAAEGAASYELTVKTKYGEKVFSTITGKTSAEVISGLSCGTEYTYYVVSMNGDLASKDASNSMIVTTTIPSFSIKNTLGEFSAVVGEEAKQTLLFDFSEIADGISASTENPFAVEEKVNNKGELVVTFAPTAVGRFSGKITASTYCASDAEAEVSGVALPQAPKATEAEVLSAKSFVAKWEAMPGATFTLTVDGEIYKEGITENSCTVENLTGYDHSYTVKATVIAGGEAFTSAESNVINVNTKVTKIEIDPSEVDFGTIISGSNTEKRKTVTVTAEGLAETITATSDSEDFTIENNQLTQNGGTFDIELTATKQGDYNATVTLTSGDETVTLDVKAKIVLADVQISDISTNGFKISWGEIAGAEKYSVLVDGEEKYSGAGRNATISGLEPDTEYRVSLVVTKADDSRITIATQSVTTTHLPVTINAVENIAFDVVVNETAEKTLTVGGQNVLGNITAALSGDGKFSLPRQTLADGENNLTVNFAGSQTPGIYNATVTLSAKYAENVTFSVSGTVRPLAASAKPATDVTHNSFTANWVASSEKASYEITVKKGDETIKTITAKAGDSSVKIDGLDAETNYTYSIIAKENGIQSSVSNEVTVSTKKRPEAKVDFRAYGEPSAVVAKWDITLGDEPAKAEKVEIKLNDGQALNVTNQTSYTFDNLKESQEYTVTLTATVDGKTFTQTLKVSTKDKCYGAQLPNFDFEDWEVVEYNKITGDEPTGWNSFLTGTGGYKSMAAKQSQAFKVVGKDNVRPKSAGTKCVKITPASVMGLMANGNLTTGRINMGSMSAAQPYKDGDYENEKYNGNFNYTDIYAKEDNWRAKFEMIPDSLTFWVKAEISSVKKGEDGMGAVQATLHGDIAMQDPLTVKDVNGNEHNSGIKEDLEPYVVAELNEKIATTKKDKNAETSEIIWERRSVKFQPGAKYDPKHAPKYMLITFNTNQYPGKGNKNDYMLIDDILMVYKPKLTVEALSQNAFDAGERISVNFSITGTMSPYNVNEAANVAYLEYATTESFDDAKTLAQMTTDFGGTLTAPLPELTAGTYYVRVRTTNYPMTSEAKTFTIKPAKPLDAPTATEATHIRETSFVANWTEVENAKGYYLYVDGEKTDVVGENTFFQVKNLAEGTTHNYYVVAYNEKQESEKSNEITVELKKNIVIEEKLAAPTANNATEIGENSFVANWEKVENATGYFLTVEDKYGIVGNFDKLDVKDVNAYTVNIKNPQRGITYSYYVIAYNEKRESEKSNEISGIQLKITVNPGDENETLDAPKNLATSDITETSFAANWDKVENAEGYIISVTENGKVVEGFDNIKTSENSYTAQNLPAGGTYKFSVLAYKGEIWSDLSETDVTLELPAPTANDVTEFDEKSFVASWTEVKNATGYKLSVKGENDFSKEFDLKETSCKVEGLAEGGKYQFSVVAYNDKKTSAASETKNVTLKEIPAPEKPNVEISDITKTSFVASWDEVKNATGYKLVVDGEEVSTIEKEDELSVKIENLAAGGTHTVHVVAYNDKKQTESEEKTVTTKLETPDVEISNPTDNSFIVNWNNVENAETYRLSVTENGKIVDGFANITVTNPYTVTLKNPTTGGTYTVTIVACKGETESEEPGSATVTLKLNTPVIDIPKVIQTAFEVTWGKVNNAEGYKITVTDKNGETVEENTVGNVLSYKVRNLTAGDTYSVSVVAYKGETESAPATAEVTAKLKIPLAKDATEITKNSFVAHWGLIKNTTGYTVTVLNENDEVVKTIDVPGGQTTSCKVEDLDIAGGTYKYHVIAYNDKTQSSKHNSVKTVYLLNAPTALAPINVVDNSFIARWEEAENATGYYLYVNGEKINVGKAHSYQVLNLALASGSTYTYYVVAYNENGESEKSNEIFVTLFPTGVDDVQDDSARIVVYPNPVADVLHVSQTVRVAEANIYALGGNLLLQGSGNDIDVTNLAQGSYLLTVKTTDNKTLSTIFVKR